MLVLLRRKFFISLLACILIGQAWYLNSFAKDIEELNLNDFPEINFFNYVDKDKYLLLYPIQSQEHQVYLYDMAAKQINKWDTAAKRALLLKNCNLLMHYDNLQPRIYEKDSEGNIAWEYSVQGEANHDLTLSEKNTILFLYRNIYEDGISSNKSCSKARLWNDYILEINRQGEEVWSWSAINNLDTYIKDLNCKEELKDNLDMPIDWLHPNSIDILKKNKWYEEGHKEFKPGNILVTSRKTSSLFIIDKETKKLVWEFVEASNKDRLRYPHEAKIIPEGYPGEGNILVFDNGDSERHYSRVLEINPITKDIVWSYVNKNNFFTQYAGSQQRLKNGDTFISEDHKGRVFIVDPEGNTVWQFTKADTYIIKRAKLYEKKDFIHCD